MGRRSLLVKLLIAALLVTSTVIEVRPSSEPEPASAAPGAHPRLLFSASDVPTLRARVLSGQRKLAWDYLKKKVDAYVGTGSYAVVPTSTYVDNQNQMPTYLIDLGMAYTLSGDTRYSTLAGQLLVNLANKNWPAWRGNQLGHGDLLRGVALSFDMVYDTLTPAQRETIVDKLVAQLPRYDAATGTMTGVETGFAFNCLDEDWKPRSEPYNNWYGVCGGGQGLALLAIDGEPGVPSLSPYFDMAQARVQSFWQNMFSAQGDDLEGLVYSAYGNKNAIPFALAWKRSTGVDLLAGTPGVAEHVIDLAFEQIPGQPFRFADRNDSAYYSGVLDEELALLPAIRTDGVADWLWDNTVGPAGEDILGQQPAAYGGPNNFPTNEGNPCNGVCYRSSETWVVLYFQDSAERPRVSPASIASTGVARHYADNGLVTMRTAMGPAAANVMMTYEAKRNQKAGGHFQRDMGHFNVYGYGARFAIDSGYGSNFSCTTSPVDQLSGCTPTNPMLDRGRALGHNVVLFDNNAQTQDGSQPWSSYQSIPVFLDGQDVTFIGSDLTKAYGTVRPARRDVMFTHVPGEPVLVAVTDSLRYSPTSTAQHTWRMHTELDNVIGITGTEGFDIVGTGQARMRGVVAASRPRLLRVASLPDSRGNGPHQVLVSDDPTLTKTPDLDHLMVAAVQPPGAAAPTFIREAAAGGNVVRVEFGSPAVGASIGSRHRTATSISSPTFSTDGEFGKFSFGKGETVLSNGKTLSSGVRSYVTVSPNAASVVVSGARVQAKGPAGNAYTVYAPQTITSVTVNGAAVTATRSTSDPNYLTFSG